MDQDLTLQLIGILKDLKPGPVAMIRLEDDIEIHSTIDHLKSLQFPNIVLLEAYFDRAGYYSRDRYVGPEKQERQIEIFGGLKWRYAEHVEWERQRIDRPAFFRAKAGLRLDERSRFSDQEMNTLSCPWHHSMTFALASFRVAKSLINTSESDYSIDSFMWSHSQKFEWRSPQLMEE